MKRRLSLIVSVAAVLFLILALELIDIPDDTLLWREIFNAGHIALFALIALLVLDLLTRLDRPRSTLGRCLLSFAICLVLGGITELVQVWTARDPDILDFARDLVGIVAVLGFHAFGPTARSAGKPWIRPAVWTGALTLVLVSLFPLWTIALTYYHRDHAFPTLVDFQSDWTKPLLFADSCDIRILSRPSDTAPTLPNRVLCVEYRALPFTGLIIQDLYPDWRGYHELRFDVVSGSDKNETLLLRIDDKQYRKQPTDRFNRLLTIPPGHSAIRILLADVQNGPATRILDLANVKRIVLFSESEPRRRFTLYFGNFMLE